MNTYKFVKQYLFVLSGLAICSAAAAATRDVPTQYNNILDAFNASANGDEIRVRKDYIENEVDLDLVGKNVTIRSWATDFSKPESGAKWIGEALAGIYGKMGRIENGSITIEGFSELTGKDCNVFMMGNDSAVTIRDCVLSGTKTADTAAVKSVYEASLHPNVNNISITLENTTATANGRVIWTRANTGTTSLVVRNCEFVGNNSYVIMWEPYAGTHTVDITDNKLEVPGNATAARNYRFLASQAPAGAKVVCDLNFDRNYFHNTSQGRAAINLAGIRASDYDADSTLTATIRNCVFDQTPGPDTTDNVAFSSDAASGVRNADITMEHCTVVLNGTNRSGIRLNETLSTLKVSNCIFDGNGDGRVAYRSLQGKTISHKNLAYVTGVNDKIYETQAAGSVELSGDEIIGESAQFMDFNNKNFTLSSTSPAVGVGENLGIAVDILGNARPNPVGSLPDLGAYERGENSSAVRDWAVY